MLTTSSPIEDRYTIIRQRIESAAKQAGRTPSDVTLVAVSKRQPVDAIQALLDLGHKDFGENVIQEWRSKVDALEHEPSLRWHLIGPIQTNKAKFVAREVPSLLHTIDRVSLVQTLEKRLDASSLPVLIQVNIDLEPQKAGVAPHELRELAEKVVSCTHLSLQGLMCIPAPGPQTRAAFSRLRTLGDEIQDLVQQPIELSMGMSQDFEDAILEGSTMVRVGSALFGPRPT